MIYLFIGSVLIWVAAIGFRKRRLEELEADWEQLKKQNDIH
jgi:hypothetical protein